MGIIKLSESLWEPDELTNNPIVKPYNVAFDGAFEWVKPYICPGCGESTTLHIIVAFFTPPTPGTMPEEHIRKAFAMGPMYHMLWMVKSPHDDDVPPIVYEHHSSIDMARLAGIYAEYLLFSIKDLIHKLDTQHAVPGTEPTGMEKWTLIEPDERPQSGEATMGDIMRMMDNAGFNPN